MRVLGVLIISLIFSINSLAQFDTNYVHLTRKKFALYPLYELSYSKIYYDFTNKSGVSHVNYETRNYNSIGIGASFYRLGFSLSYELPFSDIPQLKEQRAFSFRGGYSFKKLYADFRARYYKGMSQSVTAAYNLIAQSTRKNMLLKQIGINLMYFASSKFNFDANFKNYNLQKKSAITFVGSAGYNYYELNGKLNLIDTIYNENSLITRLNEHSMRILPGVAFSIVYKRFYISMLGLMGVSINNNNVVVNSSNNYYWNYTPAYESIVTIGYSNKDFFVSILYSIENDRSRIENLYLGTSHRILSVKVGKKIDNKYLGKLGKYL